MPDPFQPETLAAIAIIGLLAGTLGGLLGVGGSVITIPGLAILFGTGENQHLYQAAAMTANLAVALPAARRHRKAGALRPSVLRWMLPATVLFIVAGVLASNLPIFSVKDGGEGGLWLGRILAVFMAYVIVVNLRKLFRTKEKKAADWAREPKTTPTRCGAVGAVMGFAAGLMGIGGGALAVPLQQTLVKLPFRNAIANSSFVMVFSAGIGAVLKLTTLGGHYPETGSGWPAWQVALLLAGILAPTAIIGAGVGAKLTHTLRPRYVRIAFILLMIAAAFKMAALPIQMV
ncbi:MAG: sulfite exporter TauE/SafE family protein [Phycisphaeraceae bacterium]|nr:sulfite exporter TauE/SafE family protein [Phycisphaeraceae bacterium]